MANKNSADAAPDIFDGVDETPVAPETKPETAPSAETQEESNDRVTLKCPHSMTSLSHPEGLFPTVTREGTEMTAEEAKHAKAAAKAARKHLITVGGRNR